MHPSLHTQKGSGGTQQGIEMTGQLESAKEAARRQGQTGSQREQGPKMRHVITESPPSREQGRERETSPQQGSPELRGESLLLS